MAVTSYSTVSSTSSNNTHDRADGNAEPIPDLEGHQKKKAVATTRRLKRYPIELGWLMAFSWFVTGNTLTGIGNVLIVLCENVGLSSVDKAVQGLFLARGLGQVITSPITASVFASSNSLAHCHAILIVTLLSLTVLWSLAGQIKSIVLLYLWFFATGIFTTSLDTGTQVITRRIYGVKAGPWLVTNTLFFSLAGLVSPLMSYITQDRYVGYIYAGFAFVMAVMFALAPETWQWHDLSQVDDESGDSPALYFAKKPSTSTGMGRKARSQGWMWFFSKDFAMDWLISGVIFLILSCQHVYVAYIISFQRATMGTTNHGSGLLSTLWAATILSRLAAILLQLRGYTNKLLVNSIMVLSVIASLSSSLLFGPAINRQHLSAGQSAGVWVATVLFGSSTGPVLGYCFDLSHRISVSKEESVAITIFGLNMGSAILPWFLVYLWSTVGLGPLSFPLILAIVPCFALALMLYGRSRCIQEKEGGQEQELATLAADVQPTGRGEGQGDEDVVRAGAAAEEVQVLVR